MKRRTFLLALLAVPAAGLMASPAPSVAAYLDAEFVKRYMAACDHDIINGEGWHELKGVKSISFQ